MMRKISQVLIVLGMLGLVTGFTALINYQWGAGPFTAGGVILLAVGGLLYWLSSRNTSNQPPREISEPDSRPKAAAYVPWVPLVTSGTIAAVAGLFRDEPNGTFIALGIVGIVMAAVGIVGMTRIWRRRRLSA
jgi:membrane protein DedA with SNARE-associated domain